MIKLLLSSPGKVDSDFLSSLKGPSKNIVAILSSKPYSLLESGLKRVCVKKSCLILDTLGREEKEGVVVVSAESLTSLSIAINQAQQSFDGKVTVAFDSITALSIKNNPSNLLKFFSFILSRARDWNVDLIFVLPKEGVDEQILSIIKQSADKISKK